MKRSLVVILTIAVLLFAFSGFAAAEEANGDNGTAPVAISATAAEKEAAAQRLLSFGVIEGFPGGDLGLTRDITRAEFARISVLAQGLGEAASALQGTITPFSDVGTNLWFTGWINVASAHGIVRGYPDGTFRPNNNITYAEAVTMILRTLGYNDNLPGAWPFSYMVQGADLGITVGLVNDSSANAVRGNVFAMMNRAFDNTVVWWNPELARFEPRLTVDEGINYTLLQWMLRARERTDGFVTDTFHTDRSLEPNEIRIDGRIYTLVGEGLDPNWLLGQRIRAFHNGAPERNVWFIDENWGTLERDIFFDKLDANFTPGTAMDLLVRDDRFSVAPGARFVAFEGDGAIRTPGLGTGTDAVLSTYLSEGAIGRFIFERGQIIFAWIIDPRVSHYSGVVTNVTSNNLSFFTQDGDSRTINLNRFDEIFVLDGQLRTSDMDQVNENTVIYAWENDHNELFIVAINSTQEGTLTAANNARVIIGGTNVNVRQNYTTVSDDDNETVEFYRNGNGHIHDLVGDMIDDTVVALRDFTGHARHIVTEVSGVSGTVFGIVTGLSGSNGITVRESDGRSAVTRNFANADDFYYVQDLMSVGAPNREFFLDVRYQIDRNGNIRDGSLVIVRPGHSTVTDADLTALRSAQVTRINERSRFITIGGSDYTVNNRTAIMSINMNAGVITDPAGRTAIRNSIQVLSWSDLRDGSIAADRGVRATVLADGHVAQFIVFTHDPYNEVVGSDVKFGVAFGGAERASGVADFRQMIDITNEGRTQVFVRNATVLRQHSLVSFRLDSNNEARAADYGPLRVSTVVYADNALFLVTDVQGASHVTLRPINSITTTDTNAVMGTATFSLGAVVDTRVAPGAAIWMTQANGNVLANSDGQRFDVDDVILVLKDTDGTIQAGFIVNRTRIGEFSAF